MTPTETPGAIAYCERCKRKLQVAAQRLEDSKPFRLSKVPEGVCPECVMTQFLYNTYPVNMQIDEAGPELLLKRGVVEAFESCGLLSHCDLKLNEINWQWLVANWKLPVKIAKDSRNPYRMGEGKRRGAALAAAGIGQSPLGFFVTEEVRKRELEDATTDLKRILRERRSPAPEQDELPLFRVAQDVTDEVFGEGAYERLNKFDPKQGETHQGQARKRKKPN